MAWLTINSIFNPDDMGLNVIGIAAELGSHDSGFHQHKMGQLLFTQSGFISISLQNTLCILPPKRLVWIPPYTWHRVTMKEAAGYRSIYLDIDTARTLPDHMQVFEVNALLREILERISISDFCTNWKKGVEIHLLEVCLAEINQAQRESTLLKLPVDRRLSNLSMDVMPPPLKELAIQIGACEKTIGRIFMRETGLTYQQWRQQWRFLKSIELLSESNCLAPVATELGFASDSAFIAFFKKISGVTPKMYMAPEQRT